jgi:WD40 repeat protein
MSDGKSLVSGWSDGKIRAFLPQSGKLFYIINDAHKTGQVTALTTSIDCTKIVSGGEDGEVRLWFVGK